MAKFVATEISDVLIIKATNTAGKGVVARWLSGVVTRVIAQCEATAPVSDPLDRLHREWDEGGTYKASFDALGKAGSNGHKIRRAVSNTAPHAIFVERGRSATSKDQYYSSKAWPEPHWSDFTGARAGQHIMEDALAHVLRTSRAYHAHAVIIRP